MGKLQSYNYKNVDQWVNRLRHFVERLSGSGDERQGCKSTMFREKAVNLTEAIDMVRASEVAAQHIKDIDQGTSEEVVHFYKWEKANRSPAKSLYL